MPVKLLASYGNAVDFGDCTVTSSRNASTSNSVRGLFFPGDAPGGNSNIIEHFLISSAGDGIDFGDLSVTRANMTATSDSHGGLTEGFDR